MQCGGVPLKYRSVIQQVSVPLMGTPVSDIEKLLCVAESGRDSD